MTKLTFHSDNEAEPLTATAAMEIVRAIEIAKRRGITLHPGLAKLISKPHYDAINKIIDDAARN